MVESIGHYKILDPIGAGRLGDVYRGRDTRLGRTVAVRLLPVALTSDPVRREWLLARARAAARLSHPNLAALYEIGEQHGRVFLVSEFVAGEPIEAITGGRPLNARRAVDLAVQIADALAETHAGDVVCGAFYPGRVVVTAKGSVKILDIGLGASGDSRQDLSALGLLLFEMLTGRRFSAGAERSIGDELGSIVAKAVGAEGEGRYESAATLAAELRAVATVLDVRAARAAPAAVPVVHRNERRQSSRWVWLAVLAAVVVAAMWYWRL